MEEEKQDWTKTVDFKMIDKKYYIKKHILGKGNFAETYLATRVDDQKQILACKMIAKAQIIDRLKRVPNPEERKKYIIEALKNEVNLWKQLSHPNIVKFIDFSETNNNIYLFLEYCNGGDLDKLIKSRGKLTENEALKIFQEITAGCVQLYERSIIHRDLKPENILIHNGQAKIADFGFAKVIDIDKRDEAAINTSVGSPFYMPPQIISGKVYSIKCDVWSLGIMLFQTLYGTVPFSDTISFDCLAEKISLGEIIYPPSVMISNEVKSLIQRMLKVEEKDRISIIDVKAIIDELCKSIKQNPE